MTCIVGIAHEGKVILGADSAGTGGYDQRIRRDRKVFKNGELIFGFTSSFRMGQLLEFALSPPPIIEGQDAYAYAVKALVPAIRDALKIGGWAKVRDGQEEGGVFLVGFRGRLFTVHSDYQVGEDVGALAAVGCGDAYALGAMHALPDADPMTRLQAGLDAAATFSAGVSGPFHFVELPSRQKPEPPPGRVRREDDVS
jgi:ATP-dependent protease HslVU (ClpYQ) peptidase subunit